MYWGASDLLKSTQRASVAVLSLAAYKVYMVYMARGWQWFQILVMGMIHLNTMSTWFTLPHRSKRNMDNKYKLDFVSQNDCT
jgi:hypothetical protein